MWGSVKTSTVSPDKNSETGGDEEAHLEEDSDIDIEMESEPEC